MNEKQIFDFIDALKNNKDKKEKGSPEDKRHERGIDIERALNDPDFCLLDVLKPEDDCGCLGCVLFSSLKKDYNEHKQDIKYQESLDLVKGVIVTAMENKGSEFLEIGQTLTLRRVVEAFKTMAQSYDAILSCVNIFDITKKMMIEAKQKQDK